MKKTNISRTKRRTRQRLILLSIIVFALQTTMAQNHIIEVKKYRNYAKDYLTITNTNIYDFTTVKEMHNCFYTAKEGTRIGLGAAVTGINGISTKGMDEEKFYSILDACKDSVRLDLIFKEKPEETCITTLYPRKDPDSYFEECGILIPNIKSVRKVSEPLNFIKNFENECRRLNIDSSELVDNDFDWFYANTYDFYISGDDPLTDKAILERLAEKTGLKRDTINPDVLLVVAKKTDQTVASTYIPPSSRTINTGSTTKTYYNPLLERNEYFTTQHNKTINEGGYTKTTNNTDLFLEMSMLDAKKMNDPKQTTPPIIWQMTVKRHVVNPNFNIINEYLAYASYATKCYYAWDKIGYRSCSTNTQGVEIKNNIITKVLDPNSKFQVGDQILKYKMKSSDSWEDNFLNNITKYQPKWLYKCKIKRNGKRITLENAIIHPFYSDVRLFEWQ